MSNKSTISLCFLSSSRAEEPANFLEAPVPIHDFFFPAAPAPVFFLKRLRLQGAKNTQPADGVGVAAIGLI